MAELVSSKPLPLASEAGRPNFDCVARLYRWAEYLCLGPALQRAREQFLPAIQGTRKALVLGEGDGRFLAEFLRRSPETHALVVDSSAGMLELLTRRCSFAQSRITVRHADFRAVSRLIDLRGTDLVITHFALDCLSQSDLETLLAELAPQFRPGTRWLVSDFAIPSQQPWRRLAEVYVRGLYLAFRLLTGLKTQTLPDSAAALERQGFRRVAQSRWLKGLIFSELWQLADRRETACGEDGATSPILATSTLL